MNFNNKTSARSWKMSGTGRMALVVLVILQFFLIREINARPYQRNRRLCSSSLSDAINIVCKDRGFNEPFSYSGEENDDEDRRPVFNTGIRKAGLVQECCHKSCSVEYLERYCKPLPQPSRQEDSSSHGNSIASESSNSETYKIVNLPYSSVKKFQVANSTLASIIPDHRTAKGPKRKKRKKGWRKYAKTCPCRRRQRLGKKWRKVSRETVIPKVPAFQVGTTSPEPIDSIVIFPFKSKLTISQLERINGNLGSDRDDHSRLR